VCQESDGNVLPSDEEVARRMLEKAGSGSLRERESRVPVSRTVLKKWDGGDYSMYEEPKKRWLAWLEGRQAGPTYEDAARKAVEIVEAALNELRAMLPNGEPGATRVPAEKSAKQAGTSKQTRKRDKRA
jgi:hypothetical protein